MFPLYGASGAPTNAVMVVLVHHFTPGYNGCDLGRGLFDSERGKWFSLTISGYAKAEVVSAVDSAVKALTQ